MNANRKVAVVGSGIAGLSAAWLLSRRHDVTLFERDARLGGHTHTHVIERPHGAVRLDTGFLVHNTRTYPLLCRLFAELGVATKDSDMSFAVMRPADGFEYSTRNVRGFFAQPRQWVRPAHYRLVLEILRFGRLARRLLERSPAAPSESDRVPHDEPLGAFLARHRFSTYFTERFLAPMAAAIWSAPVGTIAAFPTELLARFFHNHGMLEITGHPTWRVVVGGSASYIPALTAPLAGRVHLGRGITGLTRATDGVHVRFDDGAVERFDDVVLACHGDTALRLLSDADSTERDVLGAFATSPNDAWLHTDLSYLPRRPAAQASWNYRLDRDASAATVTYDISRLQGLRGPEKYLVTLNPQRPVEASKVLARMSYRHPLYTRDAVAAQARWADVSGRRGVHFCGAYWFYGFHEDGLKSGVRVAQSLGVTW